MSIANDEQNQLSKHIREFKSNTASKNSESRREVKEDLLNSKRKRRCSK